MVLWDPWYLWESLYRHGLYKEVSHQLCERHSAATGQVQAQGASLEENDLPHQLSKVSENTQCRLVGRSFCTRVTGEKHSLIPGAGE